MSPKPLTVNQCQFQNARGQRCHMLIDTNHRPANGTDRPTLCAYHSERFRATVPLVDPEVLAAELLEDINSLTTADEVNLFLGNLLKQLVRKRIARRDALTLAYISQLILTSQTAMARERSADDDAEDGAESARLLASLRQASQELASRGARQSTDSAAEHAEDDPQRSSVERHQAPPVLAT